MIVAVVVGLRLFAVVVELVVFVVWFLFAWFVVVEIELGEFVAVVAVVVELFGL